VKKEDDVAIKKITAEDDEELLRLFDSTVGRGDLMEFMRLDQGVVLRRQLGPEAPNVVGEDGGRDPFSRAVLCRWASKS
jgi:hypothetical protein